MNTLEWLHEKVRRLGDAIFCLEEINAHPEMVKTLRDDLDEARADFNAEKEAFEKFQQQRCAERGYTKQQIPDDIRWAVWERDNYTCKSCGSRKNLTIDHIHPESKGGTLELSNLQTLCKSCNSRKGAR